MKANADPHGGGQFMRAGSARGDLALILLHGRGAGAANIVDLGAALVPAGAAFFAPEAAGRSWWPTSFLAPMAELQPWLASALAAVERAIAAANEEGYPAERILLLGFSQGACLALEAAARLGGPLAGIAAFSGGLIGTADSDIGTSTPDLYGYAPKRFVYDRRLDGVPVLITCHERDPHIPLARAQESAAILRAQGADADLILRPGAGHGIGRDDVAAFRQRFSAAT